MRAANLQEENMEYAISLAPAADSWKVVQRAEALGPSHAWFYDTQLFCAELFVAMACIYTKS
jgi:hypothetical protein